MQVIFAFFGGPEEYARDSAQRKVHRPEECPICGKMGAMRAHGYYSRSVTGPRRIRSILIWIRRFLCLACRLTTSMLPDFAQPYRLVATDTVDKYFSGSRNSADVNVWLEHLGRYQQRIEDRILETRAALAAAYDIGDLPLIATDLWCVVCRRFDGARKFTARFAGEVGMTVFGIYGCHRPHENSKKHIPNNSTLGRAPPLLTAGHENDPGSHLRLQ